jgi:cytochrome c-type biogenesis protein
MMAPASVLPPLPLLISLLAGIATIAAPCILPMLPILLGTAIGRSGHVRPLLIVLGFVLAFCACALVFSVFADSLPLSPGFLRDAAIVLLLAFGLSMLWKWPFERLARHFQGLTDLAGRVGAAAGDGKLGALVLGMSLGAVWTPCAGPVLGSILTLVASAHDLGRASAMLACYSIGAGLPMLAIIYGGQHMSTRVRRLARHANRMQQVFGMGVILTAAAMYWQVDTLATGWLTQRLPGLDLGL